MSEDEKITHISKILFGLSPAGSNRQIAMIIAVKVAREAVTTYRKMVERL